MSINIIMIFKAILLGIVEGLTEFLPVSSTGHLILVGDSLSFTGKFANAFNVVIQVGAIFAVVLYFWNKLFPKLNDKRQSKRVFTLWGKVIIGAIPAAVLGLMLDDYIEAHFFNSRVVAYALIIGAILLLISDKSNKRVRCETVEELTIVDSFMVGVFQCMALCPGMSRSASTIIGGRFMGLSREVAAEFSFFLALPTLGGAALLKLVKIGLDFTGFEWVLIGVGTFVSFIVALLVIALFMEYVKKKSLAPFAYYRIILGAIVLFMVFSGKLI
ncbi:undecaprenyl-diphosphate phosphatase [Clostridium cylindrosporum]|uniref:Undecaprenyl-diphosphatase n=1 Tax=Clostridium cylindrosporum DSM 605 TaxID=1121307 RepID=A0A0J8DF19_CLOCY|nr:undecaprenyl-diphosphate phosphatase [Clostridium cylindrosporum]KMT22859.1 undecaprenyl-diphosphatase UppP [Clostridium cylindrosporum DSM 605]